ncbi:putative amidohydrolase YtcJ [Clostridiales Family XIII bacterium PM5-7]
MAFSLFKKNNTADTIFFNGHLYTGDPEFPWAEAVACKDGKVLAVGEYEAMADISGSETELTDLQGKYMFPGFIDVHDTPALAAFDDLYLSIDPTWDLDTVLGTLADYSVENDHKELIFAYGYNEHLLADIDDAQIHGFLDEIDDERPMVVLGIDGLHCWLNTPAYELVAASMEEDCLEFASPAYILNALSPFDFEQVQEQVTTVSEDLLDRGFTTVFNMYAPNYFDVLYQDTLLAFAGEGLLKHKLIGSLLINRSLPKEAILHLLQTNRTNCIEISSTISFTFLKLELSDDERGSYFSHDDLLYLCLAVSDQGFNIHLDALDQASTEKAFSVFNTVRSKGYKKNTLVIASDFSLDTEAIDALEFGHTILTTWSTNFLNQSVFGQVTSVHEAIEQLTEKAAELTGNGNTLGRIERGRRADFTVFDENPLDTDLQTFAKMHAALTVLDGEISYNAEEESMAEMYQILLSQQL